MSVAEKDVRHVAALAHLGLAPHHVTKLVDELNGILVHMEVLRAVPTAGLRPMAGAPGERHTLRADVLDADALLRSREDMAPASRDGFFLVPRLDAHEGAGA